MTKKVRRSNVKDGVLLPLGNGFSLVKGDHPNKVDDVDIGPNNKNGLSVNHGEILQQKGNTLRVFSAEPMLGGVSPAQLLYGGMAPDKVFAMQEQYKQANRIADDGTEYQKGGIHIKPSKRGTFTAAAKQHGMSVQGFASKVLANKENYSSAMVKKANFARNASKWNHLYGGENILINSLGERPNAKYGKEMSNPVKKVNKYFERKLKEENPKMSFPERLQRDYEQLMSPPSLRNLKRRPYKKYKLDEPKIQIDSTKNNSENKRTKALYGWERDPNTGLMIPSLDFSQNRQRQILFGIHPNPANTQYNSQTFNTGIPQPTVVTVPKLYEPALDVVLGNKINQPGTSTTSTTTTSNSSGLSAIGADLIGAGINAAGSLIAAGINQSAINNQKFTPRRAVLLNPIKLKTKININPQLTKLREMQAQIADAARRTSGSSREAYRRILAGHNRTLESAMDLYGTQENQETQLINQDRLNQQSIANQNATNVINTHNTNIAGKDTLNNNWHMLTAQNWINPINVTAGSIIGERGTIAREEARRNNAANLAMMSLAYPDAARMIMNGDYWQKAFNGYYDMLNNKVRV